MPRTISNVFPKVSSFQSLYTGYKEARKGKKYNSEVLEFSGSLESNILGLRDDLRRDEYAPKGFKEFVIVDPKRREIKAPYFRDRVLHRSLYMHLEPFFDNKFIYDSYACRTGKGTHGAVDRVQQFMKNEGSQYYLKCDVRSYFDSVDHEILLEQLSRRISDEKLINLIDTVFSSQSPRNKNAGLPIGTLYSQLFANIYLNGFDHFVKQSLKAERYVRYMDDFIILSGSKDDLHHYENAMQGYLRDKLNLVLPDSKTCIEPVSKGATFLGYRIFPSYRLLRRRNKIKFRRKLRKQKKALERGEITFSELKASIDSWKGHAQHASTRNLRSKYVGGFL